MHQMRILLTLIIAMSAFSLAAQSAENTDKADVHETDTARVTSLNNKAFQCNFSAPEKVADILKESIQLAEKISFEKGLAHAFQVKGVYHDLRSEYDSAIHYYNRAIHIITESKMIGSALHFTIKNGLGVAYYHQGRYDAALKELLETLELTSSSPANVRRGNILMNIGLVYHDQKDFDQALSYYQQSYDVASALKNNVLAGRSANNIGIILKDTGKYEEALAFFNTSLSWKLPIQDSLGASSTYANMGDVYKLMKKYPEALNYLDQAERIKLRHDDKLGLINTYDTKVMILIHQRKWAEAESLASETLSLAEQVGGETMVLASNLFYELYRSKSDYEKALSWYIRRTKYNDSLFNETKSKQLAELQTLYEVNQKEKEILKLEKQNEQERLTKNMLVISLAALVVVAALAITFVRYRARKRKEIMVIERDRNLKALENVRLRETELKKELEYKNKELASYTINFVQKSELMEELKRNIQTIKPADADLAKKIAGLNRIVENSYQLDREWEDFKIQFENVHPNFFKNLKEQCPELTNGDLKLCALLKLNMNMKEAAKVLGISPESVKTSRYRLRKKLGLAQDDNLVDFVLNLHGSHDSAEALSV